MDWAKIQRSICEARSFRVTPEGMSLIADTIMPSGMIIRVFLQPDHGLFTLHDGGAAFDELARIGRSVSSMTGVRRLLSEINLRMTDDGAIFMDQVEQNDLGVAVSVLADASFRAASFLVSHSKVPRSAPLDQQLRDILRLRHRNGVPNTRIQGRNRQHKFDFSFDRNGETVAVDAVTPDITAVNAAVVKALDVLRNTERTVRPVLVYDAADGWDSSLLNTLAMGGGEYVSFDAVREGLQLAA